MTKITHNKFSESLNGHYQTSENLKETYESSMWTPRYTLINNNLMPPQATLKTPNIIRAKSKKATGYRNTKAFTPRGDASSNNNSFFTATVDKQFNFNNFPHRLPKKVLKLSRVNQIDRMTK